MKEGLEFLRRNLHGHEICKHYERISCRLALDSPDGIDIIGLIYPQALLRYNSNIDHFSRFIRINFSGHEICKNKCTTDKLLRNSMATFQNTGSTDPPSRIQSLSRRTRLRLDLGRDPLAQVSATARAGCVLSGTEVDPRAVVVDCERKSECHIST